MIKRCLDFDCADKAEFYTLVNKATDPAQFCNSCIVRSECKADGRKFERAMICHDCSNVMEKIDTIKILGVDNKLSTLDLYVCWKDQRHRTQMR